MMKKLFLLIFLSVCFNAFSQRELRLDIADALALRSLDVSFEQYVGKQSSIGVSALFNFEDDSSDFKYNENFVLTPFLRHYFNSRNNWNFFGEVFLAYNTGEDEVVINTVSVTEEYSDLALGIAFGTKYISEGGLVIDLHGGLGRNLFGTDSPTLVPRVGIGIGYQF